MLDGDGLDENAIRGEPARADLGTRMAPVPGKAVHLRNRTHGLGGPMHGHPGSDLRMAQAQPKEQRQQAGRVVPVPVSQKDAAQQGRLQPGAHDLLQGFRPCRIEE